MGIDFIKIQNGETDEFRQFFEDFYPTLCFFICKILKDEEAARDIAEEAFICFWNKKKDIHSLQAARSYLFKFAKNRSLNYLRDNHLKSTIKPDKIEINYSYNDFLIENETYRIIHNAIQALSSREKQVIELTLDGLKNPEIAKELGITVNTVKTLKSRAFKTLRAILKGISFQFFILFHPEIFE